MLSTLVKLPKIVNMTVGSAMMVAGAAFCVYVTAKEWQSILQRGTT